MLYEDGLDAMRTLVAWYKGNEGNRNEATTRFHLIDTLFFECLGWSKDDVILEEAHGGEYADYVFSAPRRVLIVEAKREGNYFELPAGKHQLEVGIPALIKTYENVADAIRQAASYCQDRAVPYGVVSNGHQLIAFIANRTDGTPPMEGRALVFESLERMQNEFLDLWNALSKSGIEEKNLAHRLVAGAPRIPQKLSTTLKSYPGVIARNILQNDLQILGEIVLEDVIPSPELEPTFLKECYSQSGALSQFSMASKSILEARYSAMYLDNLPTPTTVPATSKEGISSELLAISIARRPILLLGDVGVGKTTFIRNLIKVEAAGIFDRAVALHLDLGSKAALATDLKLFIVDEIERQLRVQYDIDIHEAAFVRGTYDLDLKRFEKSIHGPIRESDPVEYARHERQELIRLTASKSEHLKHSFEHIVKARKRQVVIFLDNADQRDELTQEAAFLIAHEIAQQWPALVFICLRPETFNRSQQIGALSGYHPKAFTISPPRIDQVILKRLRFALRITEGKIPVLRLQQVGLKLENLRAIIVILIESLERDARLFEFLDNISGGNVRQALQLLTGFIGTGHVNTRKMLERYNISGRYHVPPHEMIRAVMYGDSIQYDPSRSVIANVFDISSRDGHEHFIVPLLIGVLDRAIGVVKKDGFVETEFLYESMQKMGFTPDQVDFSLARALDKKLIQSSGRLIPNRGDKLPQSLRPTPSGLYHVYRLAGLFQYLDAVVVDTPILDVSVRENIKNVDEIGDRLIRAESFVAYLTSCWKELASRAVGFDWTENHDALLEEINSIRWRQARVSSANRGKSG